MTDAGPTTVDAAVVQAAFRAACAAAGLDLVAYAPLSALNAAVPAQHALPAGERPDPLAAVVGNSRALWEPFLDAMIDDDALRADADPIDRWVERTITAAAGARALVRFVHRRPLPPIRAFAVASGLASFGDAHLCVTTDHGPWIALRAVVVFDVDAGDVAVVPAPPCAHCTFACGPAYAQAAGAPGSHPSLRAYLAARDACPLGADARYSDAQIAWHYDRDRAALNDAVQRRAALNDAVQRRRAARGPHPR